jgi:hypothetical protein
MVDPHRLMTRALERERDTMNPHGPLHPWFAAILLMTSCAPRSPIEEPNLLLDAPPPKAAASAQNAPVVPPPAAPSANDDTWFTELRKEPSSLELTIRWTADPNTLGSEAEVAKILGGETKNAKRFQVEYFDVPAVADRITPIWRRRTELASGDPPTPKEVRLDFKLRAPKEFPARPTCEPGWEASEDIDATRKANGETKVMYSTGCEKTSKTAIAPPAGTTRTCAAQMQRVTSSTTNLPGHDGKVRIETWSIADKTIIEVSVQADKVEDRGAARGRFEAAARVLLAKGVVLLDESKTELTRKYCR